MNNKNYNDRTLCVHGPSEQGDKHGALVSPLYQTSTFKFADCDQGARRFAGEESGYIYSRLGNPTVRELELKLAQLEQSEDCAACATGMAAVSGAVMSFVQAGDHIIASDTIYGCSHSLFDELLPRFGVSVSFVNCNDDGALQNALQDNTKVIFVETPANPNLNVYDLAKVCSFAKNNHLLSIIDNTFLTPLLQKPMQFGADIVIHSATKYLNGHGDVVAGLICASSERIGHIKSTMLKDVGATLSPFDAWLITRGLKTLSLRMKAHCENAQQVAEFLAAHQRVKSVYYPGLPSHPQHYLLGAQMKGAGGVIAFELHADFEASKRFINALELCTLAVSLGDAETLIEHPASMTHATYSAQARMEAGITDSLIRISVGLEDVNDIINDLATHLEWL